VKVNSKIDSQIIFDKGANAENKIQFPQKDNIKCLAPMKPNTNDNRIIEKFDKEKVEKIDPETVYIW
jgi:hypothetical protein